MKFPTPARKLPAVLKFVFASLVATLSLPSHAQPTHPASTQQPTFAVASIRPSSGAVQFEHDGNTETSPGSLRMHDVTVITCIKWAYRVQETQITGPDWIRSQRFDIIAKADTPATDDQLKLMLQSLLADRFQLVFHRQPKVVRGFNLVVAKSGSKLRPSLSQGPATHQNSASGMVATAFSMQEFADFFAGPLETPVADATNLPGRYDFTIDFTPYLPDDMKTMRPDATSVIISALQGELGLQLKSQKITVQAFIVDHAERPSAN